MSQKTAPTDRASDAQGVYEAAAKQAIADIPAKEVRIGFLRAQLEAEIQELAYLRSIAAFGSKKAPDISPGERATLFPPAAGEPETAPAKSAYVKLHELFLAMDNRPLTVKEIQQQYALHHGEAVASSTLYAALNKGIRKNTFIQENGAWRPTTKAERDAKKG